MCNLSDMAFYKGCEEMGISGWFNKDNETYPGEHRDNKALARDRKLNSKRKSKAYRSEDHDVEENSNHYGLNRLMGFSKHKNRTILWVVKNDPQYLRWCKSKDIVLPKEAYAKIGVSESSSHNANEEAIRSQEAHDAWANRHKHYNDNVDLSEGVSGRMMDIGCDYGY